MPTRQIFNANTQQLEAAELVVDKNNEIVATFADGSFVKFPAVTEEVLNNLIEAEHTANEGKEIITPEMEQAAAEQRQVALEAIGTTEEENAKALENRSQPTAEASQEIPTVTQEEPADVQEEPPVQPAE